MMNSIQLTQQIPIAGEYDVVVVGGGIAGCAAALAAARDGMRVLLLEKSILLGGLATGGHVAIYLPLCDGRGRRMTSGIAEELLLASIAWGGGTLPEAWTQNPVNPGIHKRYQTEFNVAELVFALDGLLRSAGVDVLFDTLFCQPVMQRNTCEHVVVENKSGIQAYGCKMVIDASGDADVFFRAGAACDVKTNYLSWWGYGIDEKSLQGARESMDPFGALRILILGAHADGAHESEGRQRYDGTDAWQVSTFVQHGRRLAEAWAHRDQGKACIAALGTTPHFRTTRKIRGIATLVQTQAHSRIDDSIGCVGDWRTPGPAYEIPFGTLITPDFPNLLACGRILSTSEEMWEVTRVIPAAALTGQGAGAAAALAIRTQQPLQKLDVPALQQKLADAHVQIHLPG